MKKLFLIAALLATLAGCDNLPPATMSTIATFCTAENAEQRVGLEGYVYFRSSMLVSDTMLLDLYEAPNQGGAAVPFSILVGGGNSHANEPPDNFTDADLVIRDTTGIEVRSGGHIRVEGEVLRSETALNSGVFNCQLFTPTIIYALDAAQ